VTQEFAGSSYCPAYISYVNATAYGTGHKVVLTGLVTRVDGSTVTVENGSPCYPADAACGATLVSATIVFPSGQPLPRLGDMVNVYGVTITAGALADGYVFLYPCPDWNC
jgi:hypothetical protein